MRITPLLAPLVLVASCALGQSADSPLRFESATIKPGEPYSPEDVANMPELDGCSGGPGTPNPGLLECSVTFATFLKLSYNLGPLQFTPPEWMESSWWDIEAKVPAGTTLDQVRAMARSLLADRFKMSVHFIKKEVQAYEMSVAKSGAKFLTPSKDLPTPGTVYFGVPISMDYLASFLSTVMEWPVVNQTGLAGRYDIQLHLGDPAPPGTYGPRTGGILRRPPIEAVRDQLGLVLELTKSMVDVLVIDHVEKKPTKN